ncbi:uncharacterized protein VTP21DRAFT_10440 [Calcarisporiella thermophila]|uniref:uncharacterized protein n=1 Tax=Calcarisporiella thermophila TaxID=911321 RepID=UPI0037425BF6
MAHGNAALEERPSKNVFKLALAQLFVTQDKQANLTGASRLIVEAAIKGANIVVLPECFICPFSPSNFARFAEQIPGGETYEFLSGYAKEYRVYLIGGSIPERGESGKLYDTCCVFGPNGELVAKHRKEIVSETMPEKIPARKESKAIYSNCESLAYVDTVYGRIGVGLCVDVNDSSLAKKAAQKDCIILVYPTLFTVDAAPIYWEVMQQATANHTQIYIAACSPARNYTSELVPLGHSSVVDPSGRVIASTKHEESIVYADIDLEHLQVVRKNGTIISDAIEQVSPRVHCSSSSI